MGLFFCEEFSLLKTKYNFKFDLLFEVPYRKNSKKNSKKNLKMIIQFLHVCGQTYKLNMKENATIEQTKMALIQIYQLPFQTLEFIYNTRVLNNDEIISTIGYISNTYIIFNENVDEPDEIPSFFGEIPQICNYSNEDALDETEINDISSLQNINSVPDLQDPLFYQDSPSNLFSQITDQFPSNNKFQSISQREFDALSKQVYQASEIIPAIQMASNIPLTTTIPRSNTRSNHQAKHARKNNGKFHPRFENKEFRTMEVKNNCIYEMIDINHPEFISNIYFNQKGFDPNDVESSEYDYE